MADKALCEKICEVVTSDWAQENAVLEILTVCLLPAVLVEP